MGHAIEAIARSRGHEIVAIIDIDNRQDIDSEAFRSADVAIEFTTPATAVDNYLAVFRQGVPLVSGTTGWTQRSQEVKEKCEAADATFFWSSNFSLGVNLFMRPNTYLTRLMAPFPQYHPEMTEIHHIHKLDHPSGTAITLAEEIIAAHPGISSWTEDLQGALPDQLPIEHQRIGEVPGTHIIRWKSAVDTITIEHEAKSREGFALGAVVAAEWVKDKKGVLTMDQLLDQLINSSATHQR